MTHQSKCQLKVQIIKTDEQRILDYVYQLMVGAVEETPNVVFGTKFKSLHGIGCCQYGADRLHS
jgi:hypothetical protein